MCWLSGGSSLMRNYVKERAIVWKMRVPRRPKRKLLRTRVARWFSEKEIKKKFFQLPYSLILIPYFHTANPERDKDLIEFSATSFGNEIIDPHILREIRIAKLVYKVLLNIAKYKNCWDKNCKWYHMHFSIFMWYVQHRQQINVIFKQFKCFIVYNFARRHLR